MEHYTYLLLNILTISVPLSKSFEPKLAFWSRWRGLVLGIVVTAAVFIAWDVAFTRIGVWGFNEKYLCGIFLAGLPIEEWLFFFTIPYACIFIYEAMAYYQRQDWLRKISYPLTYLLILIFFIVGVANIDRWYTNIVFLSTSFLLSVVAFIIKPVYLGRFYMGYIISFIPFLLVNGILTGSFIQDEVVWYDNYENLTIRIFTIPIEDTVYMMLLLLMNIVIYEAWKSRTGRLTAANRH